MVRAEGGSDPSAHRAVLSSGDGNGSVVMVADGSGTIENTYGYDPWGNVTTSEKADNPIRFDGALHM